MASRGGSVRRRLAVCALGLLVSLALIAALPSASQGGHHHHHRLTKAEHRLLAKRGLWFEYDYDGDLVCYLYHFRRATHKRLRGGRTAYYVNPFTNQCRVSEPHSGGGVFIWHAKGHNLKITYVGSGGVHERFRLAKHSRKRQDLRRRGNGLGTGPTHWYNCRSRYFPYPLSAGCP